MYTGHSDFSYHFIYGYICNDICSDFLGFEGIFLANEEMYLMAIVKFLS